MKTELKNQAGRSETASGSDPAPRRKRRKVNHKCDACGSVFERRRDCFAHMDSCTEIERQRKNRRAVAPLWAVLFDTEDGHTHPVRYNAQSGNTLTYQQVEAAAKNYMTDKFPGWLVKIADIYPVEDQNK